ncbi:MAG: rhomboid family intramembrane serine protease [Chitinophagales bacterium]
MEDSYRKRMNLGQDGNALIQLLIINAVLFAVLKFIYVIYLMVPLQPEAYMKNVFQWFALPADTAKLLNRPWTILTYMFADQRVFRFISNMFWLWCFGYILQDLTGNKKLTPIYLYGGFTGAIFFLITTNLLSNNHSSQTLLLYGANPAIIAIAVAVTTVAPDYRIFPMIYGGIPLWVLTLIYILVNFSGISYGDSGTYMANLGAAGIGFLYMHQVRKGRDWGAWMNQFFEWFHDLFNPGKKKKRKSSNREEFFYNVSGTRPYKKIPNITQKRIDDILDKINQQGYRFLTEEEKDILKRAAEEEDL